jgi:hypothetical protein
MQVTSPNPELSPERAAMVVVSEDHGLFPPLTTFCE